jgi:hypothetical protein
MTTGRINQVTFHQRHSSAARDRGLGHFRSSFFHPTLIRREDIAISRTERSHSFLRLSLQVFQTTVGKTLFSFSLQAQIALFYHQDFRTLGRTVAQNQIHIQNSLIPNTHGVRACWAEALSESSREATLLTQAYGNVRDTAQCRYRRRHAFFPWR